MFDLYYFESARIHHESIEQQAFRAQRLHRSGLVNPRPTQHPYDILGDLLIHAGTRLKTHNHFKAEPATSFFITL